MSAIDDEVERDRDIEFAEWIAGKLCEKGHQIIGEARDGFAANLLQTQIVFDPQEEIVGDLLKLWPLASEFARARFMDIFGLAFKVELPATAPDAKDRFRRALEMESLIAAGRIIATEDALWLGAYQASLEYARARDLK